MKATRALLKQAGISDGRIREGEAMSRHTSFRVGGPADWYVTANDEDELAALLGVLSEEDIEHLLIGNGTNLLFPDDGYRGVIVSLGGDFESTAVDGNRIISGSAVLLSQLSRLACDNGLGGMAFASGIPGSVGGALFMNAGAYGGEMKDVVESVSMMSPDGKRRFTRACDEMAFGYRSSALQSNGDIVTGAVFRLETGDKAAIADEMRELAERRNSRQPLNYPSAGSTFKRPRDGYAAALIEEAGLKGRSVGGARVSEKHSGFIINTGGATFSDIIALMEIVRGSVFESSGVLLEPEVRIVGGGLASIDE